MKFSRAQRENIGDIVRNKLDGFLASFELEELINKYVDAAVEKAMLSFKKEESLKANELKAKAPKLSTYNKLADPKRKDKK